MHVLKGIALASVLFVATTVSAQEPESYHVTEDDFVEERVYSPYAGRAYADQVFFGDTHFHTNLSFDAGLVGTRLTMDEGYRFARGEKVISNTGQPVQLIRPLDFLVITDHAEFIGLAPMIRTSDPKLLADPWGRWVHERFNAGPEGRMEAFSNIIEHGTVKFTNPFSSDDAARSIWTDFVEKAETYNEPGRFTAMTGFEWSSSPMGNNLHRCVIFADAADKTSRTTPFSLFDGGDPEDLWKYLAGYEEKTGGRVLAIPHNGNLSNGLMFAEVDLQGNKLTRPYAESRMRGSLSSRLRRSRATKRHTPSCLQRTSSPTLRPGMSATSVDLRRRKTRCSVTSTPVRRSSSA